MKLKNFFLPTLKEKPSEAKLVSHSLMIRSGMIRMESSGIYSWLPLGFRILGKIQKIIETEHLNSNINQFLMPTIQSAEIWKKSNRYDSYGKEMLRIKDRHDKELLYGPTNEEMVTNIGCNLIKSYKNFPLYLYHIQTKFRDEIRPRFGVMRAREFIMKDAYSFDINEEQAKITYEIFFNLYLKIFAKIGINVLPVKALSGEIGGDVSHEFHLICDTGESNIFFEQRNKNNCNKVRNFLFYKDFFSSTDDYFDKLEDKPKNLISKKSIELGHIFLFGKKYSEPFNLKIDTDLGSIYPYMGSYGIGLSRIPAAVIECSHDERGIIWPFNIAPFHFIILNLKPNDEKCVIYSEKLYKIFLDHKLDVLLDDRDERIGVKFSEADLVGVPYQILVGNEFLNQKLVQLKDRKTRKEILLSEEEIVKKVLSITH